MAVSDRARKARDVSSHIKAMIGITCAVEVKSPGELPRSQGKAVRIRDQRKK
jgi:phenylacetate-CoA ligase